MVYKILLGFRKSSIHLPPLCMAWLMLEMHWHLLKHCLYCFEKSSPTHPPHSVWPSGCLKCSNFYLNILFTILKNMFLPTQPFSTWTFSLLFWEIFLHPPTPLCMVCLMLKTSKHDSLRPPRPLQIQVIALSQNKKYKQRILIAFLKLNNTRR